MTPLQVVLEQAEDDGLWFVAQSATEAYLQQELRRLHAAVEATASAADACALAQAEGVVKELLALASFEDDDRGGVAQQAATLLTTQAAELERLRAGLSEVMQWIDNWHPPFVDDDEWPATQEKVMAALLAQPQEAGS